MACTGYEHGSRVEVIRPLSNANVPIGAVGRVVAIDRSNHLLDVLFDLFGLYRGLDAHSFRLLAMLA
jgi:hypothetical protein